jgi:hypothetical protein
MNVGPDVVEILVVGIAAEGNPGILVGLVLFLEDALVIPGAVRADQDEELAQADEVLAGGLLEVGLRQLMGPRMECASLPRALRVISSNMESRMRSNRS